MYCHKGTRYILPSILPPSGNLIIFSFRMLVVNESNSICYRRRTKDPCKNKEMEVIKKNETKVRIEEDANRFNIEIMFFNTLAAKPFHDL